jgi:hypothetical protein
MEIRTVYGCGTGGKHRDSEDARRWRELTDHIRRNFLVSYPRSPRANAATQAEDMAGLITRRLNRRAVATTLGV